MLPAVSIAMSVSVGISFFKSMHLIFFIILIKCYAF
jgi:hypothetical protein